MTEHTPETGPLTAEQEARAEALVIAGRILTPSSAFGRSPLPEYRTTTDLYDLAEYVLTGRNPMTDYQATLEDMPGLVAMDEAQRMGPLAARLRRVEDTNLPED